MIPALVVAYLAVLLSYATATVLLTRILFRERDSAEDTGAAWARNIGMACHVGFLVLLGIKYGELPLAGVVNMLTFLALSLVLVHTVVEARSPAKGTGAFVMGISALLHFLSWPAIEMQPEVDDFLRSPLFGAHVIFAIAGYTAFILSAIYGGLYLVQFHALKSMQFGPFFRNLPALDHLGRMNMDGVLVGVGSLTVSMIMGLILAGRLDQPVLTDPKFIQVVLVWLAYSLLAAGYYKFSWSGRFLVYLTLGCFALLIGSMIVVAGFLRTFHQFG